MKFFLKSVGKLSVMFFSSIFYPICTVIWPKNPKIDKDKIFIELLFKTLYDQVKWKIPISKHQWVAYFICQYKYDGLCVLWIRSHTVPLTD